MALILHSIDPIAYGSNSTIWRDKIHNNFLCRKGKILFVSPIYTLTEQEVDEMLEKYNKVVSKPTMNSIDKKQFIYVSFEIGGHTLIYPVDELDEIRQVMV